MRRKQVWRYYCDFCKKAGCSGGHLKRHEERCTLNPNRVCGVCVMMQWDDEQADLATLIGMLPNPDEFKTIERSEYGDEYETHGDLWNTVAAVLPQVRKAANNCPACILAALRQARIPLPIDGFDYKAETRSMMDDYVSSNEREHY